METRRRPSRADDFLHLTEEEIERYCLGTSRPEEKNAIENHIGICDRCRERLKRELQARDAAGQC
jgi:anti-sigma factor RsiW